jgi:hypothetical protein
MMSSQQLSVERLSKVFPSLRDLRLFPVLLIRVNRPFLKIVQNVRDLDGKSSDSITFQ